MPVTTMKELLEAGVHFGHQTRRWNPKMKRFIYGDRNKIYILDLHQTLERLEQACSFVRDLASNGGRVLFVGTKRQAQESVQAAAETCGMHYVNYRWLGGTLTNFRTIRQRIDALERLLADEGNGAYELLPKKEARRLMEKRRKLEKALGGLRNMDSLPDAVFLVDLRKEKIAVDEARRLGIPSLGMVDTNCDPELVDYPIPSNDDAIRAIKLISGLIAQAVREGRHALEAEREEAMVMVAAPSGLVTEGMEAELGEPAVPAPAILAEEELLPVVEEEEKPRRAPRTIRRQIADRTE